MTVASPVARGSNFTVLMVETMHATSSAPMAVSPSGPASLTVPSLATTKRRSIFPSAFRLARSSAS